MMRRLLSGDDAVVACAVLFLLSVSVVRSQISHSICSPPTNRFTVSVNAGAGQLGYYQFAECGNVINPILGLRLNQLYTFVQEDRSNWFHPLGFAYGPDGALAEQPELEPGVASPSSSQPFCADSLACPRARYMQQQQFLGVDGTDDFGLDAYEPQFSVPLLDWIDRGVFSVDVTFDDANVGQDIFYFCHVRVV